MMDNTKLSPDAILGAMLSGNERFRRGEGRFQKTERSVLEKLAKGQHPIATVLGCSDARVPPEQIFDAVLGELFVIRVAGNVFSPEIAGSLQYAGSYLQTPLFIVLGHYGCGAVSAALQQRAAGDPQRSQIQNLVNSITPALEGVDASLHLEHQLRIAVECNVRWTMRQILAVPEARARAESKKSKLIGAIYDMTTGRVSLLEPELQ